MATDFLKFSELEKKDERAVMSGLGYSSLKQAEATFEDDGLAIHISTKNYECYASELTDKSMRVVCWFKNPDGTLTKSIDRRQSYPVTAKDYLKRYNDENIMNDLKKLKELYYGKEIL